MNLLSIHQVSKRIGDKILFTDVTLGIEDSEKIAIIGTNGSGKSTFLRILEGKDSPDSGKIVKNRELKISTLSQTSEFREGDTIRDHIYSGASPLVSIIKEYELICENLTEENQEKYNQISSEMDRLNAWDYESRIRSILQELGIENLSLRMSELSGGMLKKIELIRTLIEDSNLIILDEPTNHLDVETILWLESYLLNTEKSMILITHDRYFLDRIVNTIYEIDDGKISKYEGNYNTYLEKKSELLIAREKAEERRQNFLRKELEWLGRQPKARSTKQKARIDRAEEVISAGGPKKVEDLELSVLGKKQGKTILEIHSINKKFNDKVLIKNFQYHFKRKERLGIVGPNGIGKSTLLNCIIGTLEVDSGFIKPGVNTVFGYFDQTSRELEDDLRVLDYIKKKAGETILTEDGSKISAGQMLERFLFPSRMQSLEIKKLSGGEKRRLYLVQILMQNPNFLILDEPTNDLDIKTLSVLEEFLLEFSGCVLVVSHDRFFMDRVTEGLLVFEGEGKISGFYGSYSEFLDSQKKRSEKKEIKKIESAESVQVEEPTQKKSGLSYREKKELEESENKIESLEKEKEELTISLSNPNEDFTKVQTYSDRLIEIEKELEKLYHRWEELSSK